MNNIKKAGIKHELIKIAPALILLFLVIFWGRIMPTSANGGVLDTLTRNIIRLTRTKTPVTLLHFYVASAALAVFLSFMEERNKKHLKNILMLPYSNMQRYSTRLLVFIISTLILFVVTAIYFLVVFSVKGIDFTYFPQLIQVLFRDFIWCLLIYFIFTFYQCITGNIIFSTILGISSYFIYLQIPTFLTYNKFIHIFRSSLSTKIFYGLTDIINADFRGFLIRSAVIIAILSIAALWLYKKYPYEKTGSMFAYKSLDYIFIIFSTISIYILLLSPLTQPISLANTFSKSIVIKILVNTILFVISYIISYSITRIGRSGIFRLNKRQFITAVVVVLSLTVSVSVIQQVTQIPPGYRSLTRMLKNGDYFSITDDNEFIDIVVDTEYAYKVVFTDNMLHLTFNYEAPNNSEEVAPEMIYLYNSTLTLAKSILLFDRFDNLDYISFLTPTINGSYSNCTFERETVIYYTNMSINELMEILNDYNVLQEISYAYNQKVRQSFQK